MNGYTCVKPITLGGTNYAAGDFIPAEAVLPTRSRTLIRQKYIAPTGAQAPQQAPEGTGGEAELQAELDRVTEALAAAQATRTAETVTVPLTRDGALFEVVASVESLIAATTIMQQNAENAAKAIKDLEDDNALILLHALDSRKTVKDAAQAKAERREAQAEEEGTKPDQDAADGSQGGEA